MHGARQAVSADLSDLEALAVAAIAEMREHRGGELWSRTIGRREPLGPALALAIADPRHLLLCGTYDGITVGYAVVHLAPLSDLRELAIVDDLYTLPDARHVGVGEAMMDLIVPWATAAGACGIDAVALPGMRDTKNFFESFGLVARAIVVHRPLR